MTETSCKAHIEIERAASGRWRTRAYTRHLEVSYLGKVYAKKSREVRTASHSKIPRMLGSLPKLLKRKREEKEKFLWTLRGKK